jgi:hypothetical protein
MHFPPGFGGVNLPLPRATIEAFASLHLLEVLGGDFRDGLANQEFRRISEFSCEESFD